MAVSLYVRIAFSVQKLIYSDYYGISVFSIKIPSVHMQCFLCKKSQRINCQFYLSWNKHLETIFEHLLQRQVSLSKHLITSSFNVISARK